MRAALGLSPVVASAFRLPFGERTVIMGVVNVTPDSFSDGGDFALAEAAADQARRLAGEGADIVDIGGESTRPGSQGVSREAELARVGPVFDRLQEGLPAALSIDTTKSAVARACLARGAKIVNDVSAGRVDPLIFDEVAAAGAYLVLMHMQGTPRSMQENPSYRDVVAEVLTFLKERAEAACARGVLPDRIIVDPGIGFGKTLEHNLALLRAVPRLKALGFPVLVGASRKSLFKALLGLEAPKARDEATAYLTTFLAAQGVDIVRVHEVPSNLRAARLGDALRRAP
jgi:dihydropteroate synthase